MTQVNNYFKSTNIQDKKNTLNNLIISLLKQQIKQSN